MITGKDVREELKTAKGVVDDENASVATKLKAIYKIIEVGIKVALGNRLNLVKVMEKLGVDKVKPRVTKDEETKKED